MLCVKCGYVSTNEYDLYCQNCGHQFNSNYCSNEHCVSRNSDLDDPTPCPEDACFCPDCGSETSYYQEKIIEPKTYNQQ